mgnify:CR=1 FL=1
MNLPFIKNFNKKILPSYFLALVLRDEKVNAVIFEEISGKVKIIGQKAEYFSSSIDLVSSDEFLQILDKTISQAESSLPENVQTQKTIFGVKESWTDNDQIKKEYLAKLKKASEELGLTPIGFLVISQAIYHLLAKEEGAPISAILVEVNKKTVTVTLIRSGKIIETKSSEIHESIPFTVDTVLKHFNIPEILPSRIIIFNGKEDLSQEFISHTWSKILPFLHLPQITNLPFGFDAKAVLFGAATQMGFEVLAKDMPKETQATKEPTENPEIEEANPFEETETFKNIVLEDFGFAKDIDVAKMPARRPVRQSFSDGGSLSEGEEFQEPQEVEKEIESIPQIREEAFPTTIRPTKDVNIFLMLAKSIAISILGSIFIAFKKINIKKILSIFTKIPKGKITILIPAILLLIIALFASYFLFIKATIEIIIDPKITKVNKNILFSTTSKTDSAKNIIKGEFVSASQDGTVSTSTTGKKDVGIKAKGTVTIFNSLNQNKTLIGGTILKATNGLEFTLDSSTTIKGVASHSADEIVTPEKTTANITANQLGKESNLPSGTKFSVSSFDTSDLIAKNDNPFSGGTKKEITVVSKNDQNKLEETLPKQLEDKARESLRKQIGQNKILLPVFISSSLSKKSLNAKIGDESNQLILTGTVEFQGISYDKNDLIAFSKSLLEKDVPANQEIDYNNIKTAVLDIKSKNDEEIEANLNIKALLLPKIDEAKLTKEVRGKSFKVAQDLLYKLPQVSDVNIYLFPKIPFLPKNLPAIEKNIKILIKING